MTEQAKSLIKKYFVPGKELYKEHKLFQALVKPYIDNDSLATSILGEAKKIQDFETWNFATHSTLSDRHD